MRLLPACCLSTSVRLTFHPTQAALVRSEAVLRRRLQELSHDLSDASLQQVQGVMGEGGGVVGGAGAWKRGGVEGPGRGGSVWEVGGGRGGGGLRQAPAAAHLWPVACQPAASEGG